MKIFLISPVREATEEELNNIKNYVELLESKGHKVHWPRRDTNQIDSVGTRICKDNSTAIIDSDEIHVWWNGISTGSLFDFGMAFMYNIMQGTPIRLANPEMIKKTPHKSFENVLIDVDTHT